MLEDLLNDPTRSPALKQVALDWSKRDANDAHHDAAALFLLQSQRANQIGSQAARAILLLEAGAL